MAMTDAERQRKRRANLKAAELKPLLVRGKDGEFDERIRVALAIQDMAHNGLLDKELIDKIATASETVFSTPEPSKRKYINKLVTDFLTKKD